MTQPTHLCGIPLPNLNNFLANRRLSMLALAATVVVFVLSLFVSDQQAEWLYRDNGIVAGHLQVAYALLIPALVLVLAFEPAIRRELREAHALALLAVVGMCASFLVVRFIKPDQAWRFFRAPGILWFVIAHGVLLCALAVLLALDRPDAPASARTRRYALVVIALGGLVTLALHVVSVGEFMSLDLDDEVWLGSLATNLVSRGAYFSSANAGAFGSPDPLFSRYYLLMAEWIRLIGNSSLVTLRAFSLLVGGLGVVITGIALARAKLSSLQVIVGLVAMLGWSALVRTSHNLRMDVGLSIYGALLLLFLLNYLQDRRGRWLVLLGATFLLGMELIPPLALVMNGVIGCLLIGLALVRQIGWRQVFLYAGVCALGVLIYAAYQFLPDVTASLRGFNLYMTTYYGGGFGFSFAHVIDHLRNNFAIAPLELVAALAVLALAWRTDRLLALIVAVSALLTMAIRSGSYGYLTVLAPFFAYLAARVFRSQAVVTLGAFVLIPALLSAPIYDMATAVDQQVNRRTLEEVDLLSWRIPDGATVWGDAVFWFTLHDRVDFVGRVAPFDLAIAEGITPFEAARQLGVDVVICTRDNPAMCNIGEQLFGAPYEFNVTNARYEVYSAQGSG